MLKRSKKFFELREWVQPPSGGCVLKQQYRITKPSYFKQPPSGGCVLKLSRRTI